MAGDSPDVSTLLPNPPAAASIDEHSGERASLCFQCLKCTAGCPVAEHMDLGPSKVMRYLQLGLMDKVLESNTIWLCASCYTCATRCPNKINITHIMDALRQEAMKGGKGGPKENIRRFHELFLDSVRKHGRTFEAMLLSKYAREQGELMKNMGLGMKMFLKGKMGLLPKNVSDRKAVKKLFEHSDSKKDK